MDIVLLGIMGALAIAMVLYALLPGRNDEDELVRRRAAGLSSEADDQGGQGKHGAGTPSVFVKAAPFLSRPVMPKNADQQTNLKGRLASAGHRQDSVATMFLASKTLMACVGAGVGIFLGLNADKDLIHIVGQALIGAGLGFMLPNLWLSLAIKRRVEAITHGMPDSLDLMVVAVESGLGLDATILRVGDEMKNVHPELAEELQIASIETQMGVPRSEALTRMAARTAVQEMRALVAVITQSEKLGTSIATALRNQSDSLRTKRRQKAEERAQKTAVKLLLPLILFIFPTIFVVLAGPAAISLIKTFSNM